MTCARPNRALVELPDWRPGDAIVFDVAALVDGIDFEGDPAHCLGDRTVTSCRIVLANLGIDPDSGEAIGTGAAFRSRDGRTQ